MSSITSRAGEYSSYGAGNRETYAYRTKYLSGTQSDTPNWGQQAQRSLYNVFANQSDDEMKNRDLLKSRLWHGVPQLSSEQMEMFEAAYTGHTFIFVVDVPKFMSTGIYLNKNLHYQMRNLKSVIERASTSFGGFSNISAQFADMEDGNGRKVSHVTGVTKEQGDITLGLHEFAGLPVKNALESWLTGTYDYKSEHGHYFGNLGIPGGWCLANHTMSMLVVQVDPSWQVVQDAAFYYNMFPVDVPFDHFNWTKGEHTIVDNYSITFRCNEERSPMVMYAAERYMNNRILSMVSTSVYNSRQFVASTFSDGGSPLDYAGFKGNLDANSIIDKKQYNVQITSPESQSESSVISDYDEKQAASQGSLTVNRVGSTNTSPHYMNDYQAGTKTVEPWVDYNAN